VEKIFMTGIAIIIILLRQRLTGKSMKEAEDISPGTAVVALIGAVIGGVIGGVVGLLVAEEGAPFGIFIGLLVGGVAGIFVVDLRR
jgi:F0F1-type ATP synthase assembly protein I